MGILDSIVEWIATQVMNLLDMITGSVLGALGCDMTIFLRYFPAAETMYEVFVAFAIGFILLNLVWQLFRNFGAGIGLSAEDPVKLVIRSVLFIFLAYFSADILELVLDIAGTPYSWITNAALPDLDFASFGSVLTVIVGCIASGSGIAHRADIAHYLGLELPEAPSGGRRAIYHGGRSCLYRTYGIRNRSI